MEKGLRIPSGMVKMIALICMAIDHMPFIRQDIGYMEFPVGIFHFIGRIAAPIFFYSLAAGVRYSKNRLKYALRLLIFAMISYFPFMVYFHGMPVLGDIRSFLELNVIFTMLFGLMFLISVSRKPILPNKPLDIAVRILMIFIVLIGAPYADYGYYGIVLICVFYFTMNSKVKMGIAAVLIMALELSLSIVSNAVYLVQERRMALGGSLAYMLSDKEFVDYLLVSSGIFLSIPLIIMQDNANYTRPSLFAKYFFYVFYPLHISILLVIKIKLHL